jgi:hypothetical protein
MYCFLLLQQKTFCMEWLQDGNVTTQVHRNFRRRDAPSARDIEHCYDCSRDMTCTGGIMTSDTELRQKAQTSGATPQNQLTVLHKKYRLNIEPSAECPESASNCTNRRTNCVGFKRQTTNQKERRL